MKKKLLAAIIAIFTLINVLSISAPVQASGYDSVDSITLKKSPYQAGDWTINGTFAINAPRSYIYGNNEHVAVGSYGTVMKSTDGVNWTSYSRFANYQLTAIAWNGKNYVMAGSNTEYSHYAITTPAELFISKDAVSWSKVDFNFDDSIQYIEYGNNIFVASGVKGVYTSKDGLSWEKIKSFNDAYQYHPLQFINGKFFLIAYEQNQIYTSKDGLSWNSNNYDSNAGITNFIYYNGQYIGVNYGIYKSSDGIKWTKLSGSPSNDWLTTITTNGSRVVVMGQSYNTNLQVAYVSDNFSKWTKVDLSTMGHDNYVIYPVKDGFAGLGFTENGSIYRMYSKTGMSWSHKLVGSSSRVDFESIAFSGKRVVAVGGLGNIIYSDNGTNWHSANPLPFNIHYHRPYFNAVEYGANKFVAAGNDGIYTSKDGVSWTQASYFKNKLIRLTELIWSGKYFIASGQGEGVYYSKDGISWSKVNSVSHYDYWLLSMINDGKRIIAAFQIYNNGNQYIQLMQTTNGTTWSKLNTLKTMEVRLAYNAGTYLAADPYDAKDVWISKDAKNWSKINITSDVKNDAFVNIMTFDGYFVAFNRSLQYINGDYVPNTNYYTSKDGKQWKKHTVPAKQAEKIYGTEQIFDGVKAFGKYIFVGEQGFILSTTDLKYEDTIVVTVNGKVIKQSAQTGKAYIEGGTAYLPLRVIGEELGYTIQWNSKNQSVTFKKGNISKTFTGVKVKNDISYVPIRKVTEQLGYKINYKKENDTIYIDVVSK